MSADDEGIDPITTGLETGGKLLDLISELIPPDAQRGKTQALKLLKKLRKSAKKNGTTIEYEIALYKQLQAKNEGEVNKNTA